jgi:hypothetical protein
MGSVRLTTATVIGVSTGLLGCASFSVLSPGNNATVNAPVQTDVYWNQDLQAGSLKIIQDPGPNQVEVTSQFSVPSTSGGSHAKGALAIAPGPHALSVSGNLWSAWDRSYTAQSSSRQFVVASSTAASHTVTYTLTVLGNGNGWPQGYLGTIPFGGTDPTHPNVNLIFTFIGNTADVLPFHVTAGCRPTCSPAAIGDGDGFQIVAGTATVSIQDPGSGSIIASGTFLPSAGVFVSVDNGNGGLGFGSFGRLPSDPQFPKGGMEVAYPYAQFDVHETVDLKSNYNPVQRWAASCVGFNGSPGTYEPASACNVPPDLATTAGVFKVQNSFIDLTTESMSQFTTVISP